ncbi:hypothetical protein DLE04_01715 [Actinobacteria bacterium IMCC26103]|nr:hypothetical protein DLE04_01715 [Actinobacteria bacterium IMCC26103]
MEASQNFDREAVVVLLAREILESQETFLDNLALKMLQEGSSQIEFSAKRYLLSKNGSSHNPGFQIETENLDGSERFRNSWSALGGDENWQIECIKNQLARLMASYEVEL